MSTHLLTAMPRPGCVQWYIYYISTRARTIYIHELQKRICIIKAQLKDIILFGDMLQLGFFALLDVTFPQFKTSPFSGDMPLTCYSFAYWIDASCGVFPRVRRGYRRGAHRWKGTRGADSGGRSPPGQPRPTALAGCQAQAAERIYNFCPLCYNNIL